MRRSGRESVTARYRATKHGDGRGDGAGHQVHAQELLAQLDLLAGEQPAVVAAHDHGADLLAAHLDRRRRRRARLHRRRGRVREDELAGRVVEVHGQEVDLGQVVQGLDALPGPGAVLETTAATSPKWLAELCSRVRAEASRCEVRLTLE